VTLTNSFASPAATDADVRAAFIALDTDYGFGFPVRRFAVNTARAGQKAWFYYFTYPGKGKYSSLGAYHIAGTQIP
jgi:carboxylesterase type B